MASKQILMRSLVFLTGLIFTATLFAALVVLAPGRVLAQSDPLTFNWNEYGRQVAAGMPRSIRDPVEKVKFIADAVGGRIKQQGISPNASLVGRGISGIKFGDASLGTCDDVSESLRDALLGAGVKPDDVMLQVASRQNPIQGKGIDIVNMSHASLVVVIENQPYVFDLWMHGATTGDFSGFSKSIWSALEPAAYMSTLMDWGYSRFYCHTCADQTQKSPEDFLATVYGKLILQRAREEALKQNTKGMNPPAATNQLKTASMHDSPADFEGKKTCAALMQAISKEKDSEDAVWGKYWVVFTRPYTYENGSCVGAHQIWRKKVDGSPPYAEVDYASPEKPARIPLSDINNSWKKKFPELAW